MATALDRTDPHQTAPGFPFWVRVERSAGCWEWQGYRDRFGYGCLSWSGARTRAHRVAWELTNEPIPDGMSVLHRCDNPPCVRPAHLFLGTRSDNSLDMHAKGRARFAGAPAINATKTHCIHGHPFDDQNTYRDAHRRQRRCLTCRRIRGRQWMRAYRAAQRSVQC